MLVYCNTEDSPMTVGEVICRANLIESGKRSWKVSDEGEFCTISVAKDNCIAVVYSVSSLVVGVEIDNNCASKVIEPLLKKYGFENVKWLLTNSP